MNQILNLLTSLVDSRKDNRTMIGLVAALVVVYLASIGKVRQEDVTPLLTFIGALTGANVLAISHEDHGAKMGLPPPATPTPTEPKTPSPQR